MRDMEATIGQILLPVFNALTGAARSMGDTYATLADSIRPAMDGIATAITTVFKEMGSAARENAGVIRMLAHAFAGAVTAASHMVTLVIRLATSFSPLMRVLRDAADLLGLGGAPEERSARGMAVRNVSIGTSGEDLARKAQEAAFKQALNAGEPKEDPQVSKLTAIEVLLTNIERLVKGVPTKEDVKNFLNGLAGRGLQAAANGVGLGPLTTLARATASNLTR
jgi:hypothetical protein